MQSGLRTLQILAALSAIHEATPIAAKKTAANQACGSESLFEMIATKGVHSIGQRNTACSLSAGVSKPRVF